MTEADDVTALREEIKGVREILRRECIDWAEDHTYAQTVAKRVGVPVAQVEGNSCGVPGIQALIDMIVAAAIQKGRHEDR